MATFEGPGAITQAAAAIAASGDVVFPGATQQRVTVIGSGNQTQSGPADVTPAHATLTGAGYNYNFAGVVVEAKAKNTISGTGNVGVVVQAVIGQSHALVSSHGDVFAAGAPSASILATRASTSGRRDLQLPRIPTSADKETQAWFAAISRIFDKYIFGSDASRLVSIADLVHGGVADRNGTGVTSPQPNLTTPSKVASLVAEGALASIIIQWVNPVFPNYSHTELWRASIDDIGQAVMIQQTPVESYTDMVGSGSTKYYWARAVSTAGVKGDWNAAAGVQGRTGFDPTYVRDIMTSAVWQAVTPYAAYQYVRPTEPNGYQYACIDGGRTGGDEPAWPTAVGNTVSDGDIVWQCVAADARVPFVVGTDPGGNPAVFIDTAYIEDATITSAKIGNLVADKITTGALSANIEILSKLWSGFDNYANPGNNAGFWLGMDGGFPRLHLNTGIANGSRYIRFDGTNIELDADIMSGANGNFNDLTADSVRLTRASIDFLYVQSFVTPSDWVNQAGILVGDPAFSNFLCYAAGCRKTESSTSSALVTGTGYSRPFAFAQFARYTSIVPYNTSDSSTKYRCKKKAISFSIRVTAPGAGAVSTAYSGSYMDVYIMNDDQSFSSAAYNASTVTTGIPTRYLAKIPVTSHAGGSVQAVQNMTGADVNTFVANVSFSGNNALITVTDDGESLNYVDGTRLKVGVVYKHFYQAGGSDDTTEYGHIAVDFQIDTLLQLDVPNNDVALTV